MFRGPLTGHLPQSSDLDLGIALWAKTRCLCNRLYYVPCTTASIVRRVYGQKIQGIKKQFCLDAHRVTDLPAFPIQSTENEALAWLIMAQVHPLQ